MNKNELAEIADYLRSRARGNKARKRARTRFVGEFEQGVFLEVQP